MPIPEEAITALMEKVKKRETEAQLLRSVGIHINYVRPIIQTHWNKKCWALGNQVFAMDNTTQTFHDFIFFILRQTLTEQWISDQRNLPENDRHFVIRCFDKYPEWVEKNKPKDEGSFVWGAMPDGWTKSLASLAFDIASLKHTRNLPEHMLNRLKTKDGYQGVRYEIAIAAIFARLNCDIKFLDEQEKTTKHCEFIATHRDTGTEIAVEAKSRHREGVIHQPIQSDQVAVLKSGVERLFNRALTQNPGDKPFMIFIDLNYPPTPEFKIEDKPWFKDVRALMDKRGIATPGNPDPFNAIAFTNYSYHYQTNQEADSGENLTVVAMYPKFSVLNQDFFSLLHTALDNYGKIPNIDVDGVSF